MDYNSRFTRLNAVVGEHLASKAIQKYIGMGGLDADITPQESAGGIISFIDNLTMEQSGRFWQWNGEEHPW